MRNFGKVRKDFPILSQKVHGKPLVYLDNAATSQKPAAVIEAISNYYREYNSNIHRGVHTLAEKATQAYEGAREKVARFVGAQPSEIVFTRGTTESINLVAYSWGDQFLKAGDTILLTLMEHHSNLVPWQLLAARKKLNLEFIHVTEDGLLENPEETILRVKPKLLAFVHVSNVLGTINDVKKLVKLGHQVGATVLVDGAQAVPHLPVDVQSLGVDFYAFSGHKMLGPTGVGVLWGREELFNKMPPFQGGGEMIKEVYLRESKFKDPPHKFEAGTPSIAGVIGLGVAVDYLTRVGMAKVRDHEEDLTAYALEKLGNLGGLAIYGPRNPAQRGGVVSFNVAGLHPHDLATILDGEGIAIRSGNHCAMPLHDRLGIVASARASFAIYNTKEEIDLLVKAIEGAKGVFKV
ncbi:MAG: cysteine desulfurase [candidate division WWE3 bacterium]|nr:cysteine desulfurase [candidate division WWE3 bacterium]